MLVKWFIEAVAPLFSWLVSKWPQGNAPTFPAWLTVPDWIARVDLMVPGWSLVVGPFLLAFCVVAPLFIVVRLGFFVYHQFWGGN